MRLAYITRAYPFAHLGETFLAPEIRALASLCEELHVIPVRPHLRKSTLESAPEAVRGVRIAVASPQMLRAALTEALTHPRGALRALSALIAPRYRTSAMLKNLVLFPAALAVAHYVRTHDIEHIHAHWLTTPATVAYLASLMTGVPWSCTAHAHDIFSGNLIRQKVASARFVRAIARRNLQSLADLSGCSGESLYLIHVGVEVAPAPCPQSLKRPLQIVCPARLDPIKGHEYLIRGLATARDNGLAFQCDIVGTGPSEPQIRSLVSRLHLEDAVSIRGLVRHNALLHDLGRGRYDVVVLASLEFDEGAGHEGIPVALIEAMARGVPCISTATGCIPELIDADTGVLVPQRDHDSLAAAFMRLEADPTMRRKLGAAARARVMAHYDIAKTARDLYGLIDAGGPRRAQGTANVASAGH
jgi:glycosyltransferase involved in cell wall biosynthesis